MSHGPLMRSAPSVVPVHCLDLGLKVFGCWFQTDGISMPVRPLQKDEVSTIHFNLYALLSHDAIDIKCRDFVPDPDKLSKILQITRKMKK